VHRHANKPLIKQAVEKLYNVKVTDVRTMSARASRAAPAPDEHDQRLEARRRRAG
jgi:ribosomal protein L23